MAAGLPAPALCGGLEHALPAPGRARRLRISEQVENRRLYLTLVGEGTEVSAEFLQVLRDRHAALEKVDHPGMDVGGPAHRRRVAEVVRGFLDGARDRLLR